MHPVNRNWEMADLEHRSLGWPKPRRFVVAGRFISEEETQPTLFALGRYVYRAWVTNLSLTPAGVSYFYDGRAAMEPRISELREDYALRKIPTRSFEANALYLEIIRLAYNLVTAFQRSCLGPNWQSLMLQKLASSRFYSHERSPALKTDLSYALRTPHSWKNRSSDPRENRQTHTATSVKTSVFTSDSGHTFEVFEKAQVMDSETTKWSEGTERSCLSESRSAEVKSPECRDLIH